jgi:predicted PhzF superfamily epimerase YddE/YHI9
MTDLNFDADNQKERKMAEQGLTRHDLEAKIVKRSWENEGFRKEFSSNPVGTAAKYLKVPEAELPKIVVHEESAGTWHIVIPVKPANAKELSEADLEMVAGGSIATSARWAIGISASVVASAAGTFAVSQKVDMPDIVGEVSGW